MKALTSKLTTVPSELIRLALADLKLVEADQNYSVFMEDWHIPSDDGEVCSVCLAGAVMAKTLDASRFDVLMPGDMDNQGLGNVLRALNELRIGCVPWAFEYLNISPSAGYHYLRSVVDYEDDPKQFHVEMNKLADDLQKGGY